MMLLPNCFAARRLVGDRWELLSPAAEKRGAEALSGLARAFFYCELLAPISSWFTEGFDAVDLKEAKTLLDELT
jgi:hypothetical protein